MWRQDSAQEEDADNVVAEEEDAEVAALEDGTDDAVALEDDDYVVDAQEAAAVRCKLQVC